MKWLTRCVLLFCCIFLLQFTAHSYKGIIYSSAFSKKTLDSFRITLEKSSKQPQINKDKALALAELFTNNLSKRAKTIFVEYKLMTDKGFPINKFTIPEDAIQANPKLKENDYMYKLPVWIITYKGILPDNYKPGNKMGKQLLDVVSIVIDAMTGKALYSFGQGKH